MFKTDSDEKKTDIRESVQLNTKTSNPNQKILKSTSDLNDKQVIISVLNLFQTQDLKVEYYNFKHQISVKKSEYDNYKKKIDEESNSVTPGNNMTTTVELRTYYDLILS